MTVLLLANRAYSKRIMLMVPFNRALSHSCSTRGVPLLVSLLARENGHTDALSIAHESIKPRAKSGGMEKNTPGGEGAGVDELFRQTDR
jgi:hypothetical protein